MPLQLVQGIKSSSPDNSSLTLRDRHRPQQRIDESDSGKWSEQSIPARETGDAAHQEIAVADRHESESCGNSVARQEQASEGCDAEQAQPHTGDEHE